MKRSDFVWERKLKEHCYVTEIKWYDFDDTIENVIVKLTEISQKYTKAGYSELRLDWVTEDDYISVTVRGNIMEDDAEFNARIERQEKMIADYKYEKKKRKDKEYETYLKLKAKYEKAK